MINQVVTFKSPIEIIPSDNYLLVIKDAEGILYHWDIKGYYIGSCAFRSYPGTDVISFEYSNPK